MHPARSSDAKGAMSEGLLTRDEAIQWCWTERMVIHMVEGHCNRHRHSLKVCHRFEII